MTTRKGRLVLAALAAAAVSLIAIELALGAVSFGQPRLADPCTTTARSSQGGFNGMVERLARATLDGAACKLHTTREELVLSFVPGAGTHKIRWTKQTIDRALRAGLSRAAHNLVGNGIIGDALAFALTRAVAPLIERFLQPAR